MTNVEIIFIEGEPPTRERLPHTTRHLRIANTLKRKPGQWAILRGLDSGGVYAIKNGQITSYRPGGTFDAREVGGEVYAKYVGKQDE